MFRFTQTIIRELQPVLSKNYISGSSTKVVIDDTENIYNDLCTGTGNVTFAKHRLQLPDDGLCKPKHVGSNFYNFKCFDSCLIQFVCISWKNKESDIINARCNHEHYVKGNYLRILRQSKKQGSKNVGFRDFEIQIVVRIN